MAMWGILIIETFPGEGSIGWVSCCCCVLLLLVVLVATLQFMATGGNGGAITASGTLGTIIGVDDGVGVEDDDGVLANMCV
mmetsp:Transcript_6441/g.7228  ORF Transcript_6441/g.7228 Transcript_6441/m.7228 type:complete len:81 (+) Transcript_6441:468-710(+)